MKNLVDLNFAKRKEDDAPIEAAIDEKAEAMIIEEAKARIEDAIALNEKIITPTRLANSDYHKIINKEFKLSYLQEDDIGLIRLWVSVIDHLLFLELTTPALVLHAELIGFLSSKSSIHGFERKALISAISVIMREKLKATHEKPTLYPR